MLIPWIAAGWRPSRFCPDARTRNSTPWRGVASEREFAAGDTLMSEGDFGHSLFLVESGSADVLVEGEKVREVGPGEVLGEVAVLASGRRTASVVATSSVQVLAFFKPDVWGLERDAPEAARRLRAAMDEHLGSSPGSSSDE